jgi:REP element-mobilizing transposase RayT
MPSYSIRTLAVRATTLILRAASLIVRAVLAIGRSPPTVAPTGPPSESIGALMAGYKSAVTKRINLLRRTLGYPVWQRNYYEHIIRNDKELNQIRQYIILNPVNWEKDTEFIPL